MSKLHILPTLMKEHDLPDVVAVTESWCNVRDVEGLISIPVDFVPPGCLRGHQFRLRPKFTPNWNYARYCFSYRPVDIWNRLPNDVVSAPDLVTFKRLLHVSGALPQL